ncbi:aromatic ring-hydroxylating dioxygenase subunit alpha [Mycobacterium intracellulare]|uniref:aromatic ring-hydroxylating oxygenase subunit alpha n=1 Tax=Mycobacterium intracellulare TaxID=1767 RepID=UPI001E4DD9B7|nr:aromatic ring-hydroxylating dioxygenase subunit alpha [Mycobacterium intracellulare]UGU00408.1 aromatic ring-hydroxylating dioxygenase subunit alpha [Mycobacterium intracellulare]
MTTQLNPETKPLPDVLPYTPQHNVDTSKVPFRIADGVHIAVQRYFDRDFAELEYSKMWLHTWQWATREEYIPLPGDYIEYNIGDKSVIIVRQKDDTIKALENVCPHRATQFAEPNSCGTFGGDQIVCPFHGWRFNIDGSQSYIYGRHGFVPESIHPDKLSLKTVRSAVKYGFVWLNFDDAAPSIEEFFGSFDNHIAPTAMERMRVRWWKHSIVACNWKIAIEAFMEAYHIMQAHPELAMGATGDAYNVDNLCYFQHGMGHVGTTVPFDANDPPKPPIDGMSFGRWFIETNRVLFEGTDATNTARDEYIADRIRELPDDHLVPRFFEELYSYSADAKIPLPTLDPNASNYGYVFPNMVFVGMPGNVLFYRVRPNGHDPNSSIYEALAMQIPREADMNNAAPSPEGPLRTEQWPFVLRQDLENVARQQKGYRSGAITHATMSPRYEQMIYSLHNEIDRYIATY